jgi:hypothetical protein
MDLSTIAEGVDRFEAYLTGLTSVIPLHSKRPMEYLPRKLSSDLLTYPISGTEITGLFPT